MLFFFSEHSSIAGYWTEPANDRKTNMLLILYIYKLWGKHSLTVPWFFKYSKSLIRLDALKRDFYQWIDPSWVFVLKCFFSPPWKLTCGKKKSDILWYTLPQWQDVLGEIIQAWNKIFIESNSTFMPVRYIVGLDQISQGKTTVYAPGRVDYLDLLSVFNSLTMAEAFRPGTTLFSTLFYKKVNILYFNYAKCTGK